MATNQSGDCSERAPRWFVAIAFQLTNQPTNYLAIQLSNSPQSRDTRRQRSSIPSMTDADMTLSILLVEDDPVHAHLAQAALQPAPEGCDWRLVHVETLAAACASAEPPDL